MWSTVQSPFGQMRLVCDGSALTAVEFPSRRAAAPWPARSSVDRAAEAAVLRDVGERDDGHRLLQEAARQLTAYFDRDLREFDLPLAPRGTPFQQEVWRELRRIGYGQTTSYGELARRLDRTVAASRAVGLANGRNPIAIVIPCHRVVGAGGRLIGYAGGLDRKQTLLALERDALGELPGHSAERRSDSDSLSAAARTAGACILPG